MLFRSLVLGSEARRAVQEGLAGLLAEDGSHLVKRMHCDDPCGILSERRYSFEKGCPYMTFE